MSCSKATSTSTSTPSTPAASKRRATRSPRKATTPTRATPASVAASASSEPVVVELKVEGMMCDGCAESVTVKLMKNDKGVKVTAVDVDLATKIVRVSIECESVVDGVAKLPALVETVVEAGFEAEPIF